MNYMDYWKQQAAPWISFAVLVGGLVSSVILFWLMKIENEIQITSISSF